MCEQNVEARRALDLERYHRRTEARRAAGLCLKCGRTEPEPERTLCAPCAEKRNAAGRDTLVVCHGVINKFIRAAARGISGGDIIALGEDQEVVYQLDGTTETELRAHRGIVAHGGAHQGSAEVRHG